MNQRDLKYYEGTCLPPATREEIAAVENNLRYYFSDDSIKFPESLVYHFLNFHGGIPRLQCFDEPNGGSRMICRFCNVLNTDASLLPEPRISTWRNRNLDARLDYTIDGFTNYFDYEGRLSQSGGDLVPIAVLNFGDCNGREEDEMDLLCLDYTEGEEPAVVTWCFESSWSDPEDTIKVADSFDQFLDMLYERPADFPVTNEIEYY